MAERVLVTGGAGFIGLHLVRRLLADGAEVTVLDDFSRGREDSALLEVRDHVTVVPYDLRRPIDSTHLKGDWDTVYHLAAVVGVARAQQRPAHVLRTNVLTTVNLLDWCERHPPRTLFLSSTSEVADGAMALGLSSFPASETVPFAVPDPHAPRASYALSKVVSEALALHAGKDTRMRIARYHNVYGARMGHSHVIPQFIDRLQRGENPFRVYGPAQTRSFCHVDDAIDATVALARLPHADPRVVNIGNDQEEIAAIDLARLLFDLAGCRPRLELLAPPPGSPQRRLPDLSAARRWLDYRPRVALVDGLRRTFDWYTENAAGEAR